MHRIVISDTTAIIHLAKINALHILKSLYQEILIPQAVCDELVRGQKTQPGMLQVMNSGWIKVVPIKNTAVARKLQAHLDLGESEAIALALETNADLLIIDEKLGRDVAKSLVNKIIGVIGVLLEAKKLGIIPAIESYLVELKKTGFLMSKDLVDLALKQAGELNSQSLVKK